LEFDYAIVGGLICGALAGGGARFGRLCSMSAIEDALVGHDYRGAKAWGLAVGVAGLSTMALTTTGWVDLATSPVLAPRVHVLGTVLGGALFGLGMTLVGTCSFGLLVRAGAGDLRAVISAMLVGVFAFAITAGLLAPVREVLLGIGQFDLSSVGGASLDRVLARLIGPPAAALVSALCFLVLVLIALLDRRLLKRPRLVVAAIIVGLAVAGGWAATSAAVADLSANRVESLSFVAPTGRALLQLMSAPFRNVGFGMAAVLGVVVASFAMAALRGELRWEAFDDPREMRRHLMGAVLMGIGGVLAQGCTVGQGLTAASVLALSAPVFMLSVLVGAQVGLRMLIEGTALWRLGFSTRAD
jgi:uncharacterized membrane protein YedE/YeeE